MTKFKTYIEGKEYVTTNLKQYKKWLIIKQMIQDHKDGVDIFEIVSKYKYKDVYYVKHKFVQFGYEGARLKKAVNHHNKPRPKTTKKDMLWNTLLTNKLGEVSVGSE